MVPRNHFFQVSLPLFAFAVFYCLIRDNQHREPEKDLNGNFIHMRGNPDPVMTAVEEEEREE